MHRRAIDVARLLADTMTSTPRARARAEAHRSRGQELASQLGHAVHGATASLMHDHALPPHEKVDRDAFVREQLAIADQLARPRAKRSTRRKLYRRNAVIRMTSERALPIAIAMIVVVAAGVSLAPAAAPVGANEPAFPADAAAPRLVVGGGVNGFAEFDGVAVDDVVAPEAAVDDGTLYKPVAVDTSVKTSAGLLEHYTVKQGDTLTGIASRFGVSMMTVWWANKLTSKDEVKPGRELVIPPVNGLVTTVKAGDTLDSIAEENKVTIEDIIATNELDDPNLIVGQVLLLPGAKGDPMPTPKPTPTPKPRTSSGGGGGGGAFIPTNGSWSWPVPGGYVSQGFHYGHYGVDIAHDYGSSIIAPRAGHVVFAGWKANGGGYQVWIYHGNGIYSGHHHMSAVLVSAGQDVSKGQRIGRVGSSGNATGPHDHFEVWVGYPWKSGSYRVNPLKYY